MDDLITLQALAKWLLTICAAVFCISSGLCVHYAAASAAAQKSTANAICEILKILRGRAGDKDG